MLIITYIFVEIALWPQTGDSPPRTVSLSVDALTQQGSWGAHRAGPPEAAFPKVGQCLRRCSVQRWRDAAGAFCGWFVCAPPKLRRAGSGVCVRGGVHVTCLFLGNVTSASGSQMASGVSLGSFGSRPDGMQQRSYSVSSADQWSEATVIANSAISSGKRGAAPRIRGHLRVLSRRPGAGHNAPELSAPQCGQHRGAALRTSPFLCGAVCPPWAVSPTSAHLFLFGAGRSRCPSPPDRLEK